MEGCLLDVFGGPGVLLGSSSSLRMLQSCQDLAQLRQYSMQISRQTILDIQWCSYRSSIVVCFAFQTLESALRWSWKVAGAWALVRRVEPQPYQHPPRFCLHPRIPPNTPAIARRLIQRRRISSNYLTSRFDAQIAPPYPLGAPCRRIT